MSLANHLIELRRRLGRAALAVVLGTVAGWLLSDGLLAAIRMPVELAAQEQNRFASLNYDSVTGAFDLKVQIAFTIGIVISSPIWLYQIWAFFIPGLTRKEIKYSLGFFLSAVPLFVAGCAAGTFVFPHIVQVLTGFVPTEDSSILRATDYFTFILKLTIAVGVAFVLPVFIVLLNFMGVISAKGIIGSWRVALIAIVLFSALTTPSADVVSMFVLAIPMVALYAVAAGIATVRDRSIARATRELVS
jgi:sec-independent protein translocase protein TatC